MSGYEWLTKPNDLSEESLDVIYELYKLYKRYLEELGKKDLYDKAIMNLYDYGTIRAPLYLLSLHVIRRVLVTDESEKVRGKSIRSGSNKRRAKGTGH